MDIAANIVVAYLGNNTVNADQVPSLYEKVFDGLVKIAKAPLEVDEGPELNLSLIHISEPTRPY